MERTFAAKRADGRELAELEVLRQHDDVRRADRRAGKHHPRQIMIARILKPRKPDIISPQDIGNGSEERTR